MSDDGVISDKPVFIRQIDATHSVHIEVRAGDGALRQRERVALGIELIAGGGHAITATVLLGDDDVRAIAAALLEARRP